MKSKARSIVFEQLGDTNKQFSFILERLMSERSAGNVTFLWAQYLDRVRKIPCATVCTDKPVLEGKRE